MKQLLANFLDAEESIVDLSASQDLCEFREVAAVGLSTEVERFYGTPPGETDRNRNWEDHVNFLRSPISGGESEDEILLGKISILEAGIGAGKTTLGMLMTLLACSKGKKAIFIEEPSNDRKLQKFLENMQKKALKFQKRMLGYRVQILRLALELTKRGYNVLLDRSLYGDRVFEHVNVVQGNITPEQHAEYLEYFLEMRRLYEDICRAATVFYFPQTLEETKARIKKRNRTGEVGGYTDEYLNQINDTYAKYLLFIDLGRVV
jgi:deoxyadenosine/deoxycytidine kinase